jgi:hypothetical protein
LAPLREPLDPAEGEQATGLQAAGPLPVVLTRP